MFEKLLKFAKTYPPPRWWMGASLFLIVVAVGGLLMRAVVARSCQVEAVNEATSILMSLTDRFDDVYSSAANGTPDSLEYPLSVMQQILMDTRQVETPACMKSAQDELVGYMDAVIRAFWAYTAGESESVIQSHLEDSYFHIKTAALEMQEVKQCAPYCVSLLPGGGR